MVMSIKIEVCCEKCNIKEKHFLQKEDSYDYSVTLTEYAQTRGRIKYIKTNPEDSTFICQECGDKIDFYI